MRSTIPGYQCFALGIITAVRPFGQGGEEACTEVVPLSRYIRAFGWDAVVTQGANTVESNSLDPAGNRAALLGASSYTPNSSNEKIKSASLQIIPLRPVDTFPVGDFKGMR